MPAYVRACMRGVSARVGWGCALVPIPTPHLLTASAQVPFLTRQRCQHAQRRRYLANPPAPQRTEEGRCTIRHIIFDQMLWGCFRASAACQLALLRFLLLPPPPSCRTPRLHDSAAGEPAPRTLIATATHSQRLTAAWCVGCAGPQAVGPPVVPGMQGCGADQSRRLQRPIFCWGCQLGSLWLRVRRGLTVWAASALYQSGPRVG